MGEGRIRVHVTLLGVFGSTGLGRSLTLELPSSSSVSTLLERLKALDERLAQLLSDTEYLIVVDGRPGRPDARLRDGSRVAILPAGSGG